jgi:hypothetical protein
MIQELEEWQAEALAFSLATAGLHSMELTDDVAPALVLFPVGDYVLVHRQPL